MNKELLKKYGPWALVTGASSGIGFAFAKKLAQEGFNLALVARRKEMLCSLAQEVKEAYKIDTQVIAADLSRKSGSNFVLHATQDLDIGLLVASAGFGTTGPFIENDFEESMAMIDLNCRSLAAQAHHFGRRFQERGRGGIILLSSLVSFQGSAYAANYSATKAYVQSLAEGIRPELKPHGVDVIACAPGPVATGFAKRANMNMGPADKADDVANKTLRALGCCATVYPGPLARILGSALHLLPRRGRVYIMSKRMLNMAKKKA